MSDYVLIVALTAIFSGAGGYIWGYRLGFFAGLRKATLLVNDLCTQKGNQ